MKKIHFLTNELKSLAIAQHFIKKGINITIADNKKKFSFDDSFEVNGKLYDCGYHAIDNQRCKVWTDILDSLPIEWTTTSGNRKIVIMGKLLDRDYPYQQIENLVSSQNCNQYTDDTFLSSLENQYGTELLKYFLENSASSYTQNILWNKNHMSSEKILTNIYPWFFPKNDLDTYNNIQYHYHNQTDDKKSSRYPTHGAFNAITNSLRQEIEQKKERLVPHLGDCFPAEFDKDGKLLYSKESYINVIYLDYFKVAEQFKLPFPQFEKTYFYLTSINLDSEISFDCNEILVADKQYLIDRISSPDVLQQKKITKIQFESESINELTNDQLLENITLFFKQHISSEVSFSDIDIKKVKIKRYCDTELNKKTESIINFIEDKNPNTVILNRSMNFENLADSIQNVTKIIGEKLL